MKKLAPRAIETVESIVFVFFFVRLLVVSTTLQTQTAVEMKFASVFRELARHKEYWVTANWAEIRTPGKGERGRERGA